MADPFSWAFWIGTALSAGGHIAESRATEYNERLRIQQLQNEKKAAEIAALDEEVQRMQDLRFANSEFLAVAGQLDPYASPSLLALRRFNMEQANKDVKNLYTNLATERANISAMISISRRNIKSARTSGLLGAASTIAGAAVDYKKTFTKPKSPKTKPKKGTTPGGGWGGGKKT